MHPEARAFISQVVSELAPRRRVLEFGSRNVNGGVREFFPSARFYGIDIEDGDGVDEVADAADFDCDWQPDAVVCSEVLEHTPRGAEIVANAHRLLAPGGVLILTAAAPPREVHSAVDGSRWLYEGEHYENVTEEMLASWLEPFGQAVKIEYDANHGDVRAVAVKPRPAMAEPVLDWAEVSS